jgi:DNA-binding NtrC family response regulator
LFLDEVGDIPLTMQVKLLRLLETGTYRRVGSTEQRHADIRVVSATHRDLDQMVAHGRFREDLYYRLSTFPIHLPALRDRRDDVPLLTAALLERVASKRKLSLSSESSKLLQQQTFPGNVRELRNLLERAALLCDGAVLETSHITQALDSGRGYGASRSPTSVRLVQHTPSTSMTVHDASNPETLQRVAAPGALNAAALAALSELTQSHTGSRADLANKLGISERSLYRKLKALKPD